MVMSLFRLYIPEVIQTSSNKGDITWAIEPQIYFKWKDSFKAIEYLEIDENVGEKKGPVYLTFTDGGGEMENIMRVLLKIGTTLPKPEDPDKSGYYGEMIEIHSIGAKKVNLKELSWEE